MKLKEVNICSFKGDIDNVRLLFKIETQLETFVNIYSF